VDRRNARKQRDRRVACVTPAAHSLITHAIGAGLVDDAADLDLVEQLAIEVTARRQAYLEGQASIKEASLAVCQAADWSKIAHELDNARRVRAHRARMLDASPRPRDFPGRRTA